MNEIKNNAMENVNKPIKNFTDIAFTESVKEIQRKQGSRNNYLRMGEIEMNQLNQGEQKFITERDMFYMSTVGENGWPYVQYRGGPKGFLKVLSPTKIAFADFRGNMQYISSGNLRTNNKVALILIDYPTRTRLKIWGETEVLPADDPFLKNILIDDIYPAKIERLIVINVKAFDWNCPQHITPRYTEEEFNKMLDVEAIDLDCETAKRQLIKYLRQAENFKD
ncbi:pyridoxamine 5'-phosphate oxidase family protein [Aquimarina sp. AU474]|uniref:pyridoxamine 5'-phosphate oxidase family protein n=1 Tax=Aquimarina sp. AU474 TaxID=2108529 RepID=UPI00190F1DA3|nr:pyridoxamine 5'-phosphate oxidase family protein [Aquimarina sp. AU474]